MSFGTIIYDKEDGIGIITMNRPGSMNAFNDESVREFGLIIEVIEDDRDVGAVIVTGCGKVFSAGADIKFVSSIGTPLEAQGFVSSLQSLFTRFENLKKPTIAAVGGPALGGGCELALACDIRLASENAVFGVPEIKIGVLPGAGGTQRLPRLIGLGRAKEMLYTGDSVDASEAYRIGLVNKVVKSELLMDEAKEMGKKLKKRPAYALKMIKRSVNRGINMDLQSGLAHEARCVEILFYTEDQKEGFRAFMEKREPIFKGK